MGWLAVKMTASGGTSRMPGETQADFTQRKIDAYNERIAERKEADKGYRLLEEERDKLITKKRFYEAETLEEVEALKEIIPTAPPDLGEFRFIAWSVIERREIMVKDIDGDKYEPGMTVTVKFKAKNFGTGASVATVKVKDLDTGETVTTYTSPSILPGYNWMADGVTVGKMPKRNWRLEFKVTP